MPEQDTPKNSARTEDNALTAGTGGPAGSGVPGGIAGPGGTSETGEASETGKISATDEAVNAGEQAANAEKKQAALSSLFAALLLTGLKIAAGIFTGSLGILAEAAHSALDLVAAGVTFMAIRISSRPPDKRHPYGHGKVENLSALIETLLLLLTCGWIVNESLDRLLNEHEPIRISIWAFAVMLISIAVDFSRSRMLKRMAKKHNSQALEADALHFSTDIFSSLVVLFGLGAVWLADFVTPGTLLHGALLKADAAAALVVAAIVVMVSLKLGRRAVDTLLDAGDASHMRQVEEAVAAVPEVLRISRLRLRESGPKSFVDMEVILPAHYNLTTAHEIAVKIEQAVLSVLPGADVTIHCEPESALRPDNFFACIRNAAISHKLDVHDVEVHQIRADGKERTFVTLHAEVEGSMSLAEAHQRASDFETDLARFDFEVLTHIEPRLSWIARRSTLREPGQNAGLNADQDAGMDVERIVAEIVGQEQLVSHHHRLCLLETDGHRKLSFHCCLPGDLSVNESHGLVSRVEQILREKCPDLHSITVHAEPEPENNANK